MWDALRRRVDEDYTPRLITDPVLDDYTEEYLLRTSAWLDRWGIMPRAGGLDDQELAWVEVMELIFGMKNQVVREYIEWKRSNGG